MARSGRLKTERRGRGAGRWLCAGCLLGLCAVAVWPGTLRAEESLAQRRARIEQMDPAAKAQLLRQLESFRTMTPQQQARLRSLHQQLDGDPQAEQLRQVMRRYHEWLKTLKPYQKAELADLPPRERVERIKRILQDQARRESKRMAGLDPARIERYKRLLQEQVPKAGKRLAAEDVEGLWRWLEQYAASKESQLLEDLPAARRQEVRQQLQKIIDPSRRREMLTFLWVQGQLSNPGQPLDFSAAELEGLCTKLSAATQERLRSLPEAERRRTLTAWVRLILLHHAASHFRGRAPGQVSQEELADFLEHQLSPEVRDRLLGLAPEEMQRELWALYWRSKLPEPTGPGRAPRPKGTPAPGKPARTNPKKSAGPSKAAEGRAETGKEAKSTGSTPEEPSRQTAQPNLRLAPPPPAGY